MQRIKNTNHLLIIGLVAVVGLLASATDATIIVRDWQFNTPGDNEGWTAGSFQVNNLHVGAAVQGSETVLTSDNLQNQADPKLFWPADAITLPVQSTAWEELTIRLRQIGDDGVTPVAFDASGTIATISAGAWPTIAPFPTSTNLGATVPVTVEAQADQWLLVTFDMSAFSGTVTGGSRMDPVAGNFVGDGVVLGNFEIDYVTLTSNGEIPEPASIALLGAGGLMMLSRRRSR